MCVCGMRSGYMFYSSIHEMLLIKNRTSRRQIVLGVVFSRDQLGIVAIIIAAAFTYFNSLYTRRW